MRARIVLHAHSTWSYDGHWSVEKLARTVSGFGANVLMMTEHSQLFDHARMAEYRAECHAASGPRIRVIPGMEYSTERNETHILTWGVDDYLGEELSVDTILDAVARANGIAIFAHPNRRDVWKKFDPAWAKKLYAMEAWNRKSDGLAPSEPAMRLIAQHGLAPVVSLDFHRRRQLFPLYNVLEAPDDLLSRDESAIVELIRTSRLEPRFFGLPMDGSDRIMARLGRGIAGLANGLHKRLVRRSSSKRRRLPDPTKD